MNAYILMKSCELNVPTAFIYIFFSTKFDIVYSNCHFLLMVPSIFLHAKIFCNNICTFIGKLCLYNLYPALFVCQMNWFSNLITFFVVVVVVCINIRYVWFLSLKYPSTSSRFSVDVIVFFLMNDKLHDAEVSDWLNIYACCVCSYCLSLHTTKKLLFMFFCTNSHYQSQYMIYRSINNRFFSALDFRDIFWLELGYKKKIWSIINNTH